MAKSNATATDVHVIAIYSGTPSDNVDLWGVRFTLKDGSYTATVPEDVANDMVDAGRVKLA